MTDDRARELARSMMMGEWAYRRGRPDSGFNVGVAYDSDFMAKDGSKGRRPATTAPKIAARLLSLPAFGPDGAHPVPSLTRS